MLAIYVPYAVDTLGMTATGVGFTLSMYGVGMKVGALFAPWIMRRLRFGVVTGIGPTTSFAGSILMALTIIWPCPELMGAGFFLLGVGPILWVISTATLRQSVTPAHLLGRVSAINIMTYGSRPIGAGIGALVGGLYGGEACLLVAVLGFGIQLAIILLSPVVRLITQPTLAPAT